MDAQLSLADAKYGFLKDSIAAERAISFYTFLEPADDVEALMRDLAQKLQTPP